MSPDEIAHLFAVLAERIEGRVYQYGRSTRPALNGDQVIQIVIQELRKMSEEIR